MGPHNEGRLKLHQETLICQKGYGLPENLSKFKSLPMASLALFFLTKYVLSHYVMVKIS